jgi:hypothetical protein
MSLEKLTAKYIASTEQVFSALQIVEDEIALDSHDVKRLLEFARAYLNDAKYYRDKKRFKVSLTSIAYCEGIIDALKLIGAIKVPIDRSTKPR